MKLDWKTCIRIAVCIFGLYLAIHYWPAVSAFLGKLLSAAAPVVIGGIIAYPLNILMGFYSRHYFPGKNTKTIKSTRTPVCLVLAIITLLAIITAIVALIVPQLIECFRLLLIEIPDFLTRTITQLQQWHILSGELADFLNDIDWKSKIGDMVQFVTAGLGDVMDLVITTVSSVFSGIATGFLSIIFALYLVLSKTRLKNQCTRLLRRYVKPAWCEKVFYTLRIFNDSFHKFIVGQCTEAVILGALCVLGMVLCGLPYAAMIGALVGFTALIPVVGAFVGAGVGAFLILMQSPLQALIFLVFILVLQQVEGNIIYPRVVGTSIGLPGLWVLAAVTIGGGVMGVFGMLLGVPLAASVYRILRNDLNKIQAPIEPDATSSE